MPDISIRSGSTVLYAALNNTVAARDFAGRLPVKLCGTDSGTDYCCRTANGLFDPMELQEGWSNGDLCLCDGWFSILYAGQEHSSSFHNLMIIGHLREDSLQRVHKLPQKVTLTVELVSKGGQDNENHGQRGV